MHIADSPVEQLFHLGATYSFYAADAGCNGTFAEDAHHAYVTGIGHMSAAAKLNAGTILNHANTVAIFLSEERHSTHLASFVDGQIPTFSQRNSHANSLVDKMFNLSQFLRRNFLEMREVETQTVGMYQRAFLLHMRAEHFAQSLMQQVSGRVVGADGHTAVSINAGNELLFRILRQLKAQLHTHIVFALGVKHLYLATFAVNQDAAVAYLTAHLGIERSARQHNLIILLAFLLNAAITQYLRRGLSAVIAHKFLIALTQHNPFIGSDGSSRTGASLLLLHLLLKRCRVEAQIILLENQLGEVEGEAVSVIESERILATDFSLAVFTGFCHQSIEQDHALGQGAQESLFLLFDNLGDESLLSLQFGISLTHLVNQHRHKLIEEGILLAQE